MNYTEVEISRAAEELATQINKVRATAGLTNKRISFGFATSSRTSIAARLLKQDVDQLLCDLVSDCKQEWHTGQHRKDIHALDESLTIMVSAI